MLARLDWEAPWFAPWRGHGQSVAAQLAAGQPLHAALDALAAPAAPVRFVAAGDLPRSEPYERYVFARRACPTRENLHDFFNGLCWLGLPHTKRRLNELHAHEIDRAGVGTVRGPVRDRMTLFDENGAVLQAPPALWDALLARDWQRLFIGARPLWRQARLTIVGHALLEQLVRPRKALTAHVLALPAPAGTLADVDRWLARQLTPSLLAGKPFTPLPVLGVPGWSAENQNFSFYDDSFVFRAAAATKPTKSPAPDAPRP